MAVLVQELDRLLDGEDVARPRPVDAVDERRQRGGRARPVRTAHEHEAARWSLHSITSSGSPRSSGEGMPAGTSRSTAPTESRCTKADTRKRPLPGMACEVASSPSSRNRSRWCCVSMPSTSRRTSEPLSGARPSMRRSSPCSRTTGGEPTVRWRSEPPRRTTRSSRSSSCTRLARGSAAGLVTGAVPPPRRRRPWPGPYIWPMRRTSSSRTATAGMDRRAEVGLEGREHLLVARVVHGDDHAVVTALERHREVAAGEVFGHEAPHVGEDRSLGQVDVGNAELVGDGGGEVLLADQLVGDEQVGSGRRPRPPRGRGAHRARRARARDGRRGTRRGGGRRCAWSTALSRAEPATGPGVSSSPRRGT